MRPKLKEIEKMLQKGGRIELSDSQYEKMTGIPLPKNKRYIIKGSALARLCEKYEYYLEKKKKKVFIKKK